MHEFTDEEAYERENKYLKGVITFAISILVGIFLYLRNSAG